ncbi:hypothetical protein C5S36_06225 [Candidatus Methanophagaceae archaeon]|nr:hypothetical protein C5S36_06225 [Methanophagales archaeon]
METDNGWLNCTQFTDANDKKYDDGRDTRDKIMARIKE